MNNKKKALIRSILLPVAAVSFLLTACNGNQFTSSSTTSPNVSTSQGSTSSSTSNPGVSTTPSNPGSSSSVDEPVIPDEPLEEFKPNFNYQGQINYSAKYLGEVQRRKPLVKNEGLERYPTYGTTLANATTEEKLAIIAENNALLASSTTYDSMDELGNLYLNGKPTGKQLYKHMASENMYFGNVDDNEPAIIKQVTYKPRDGYKGINLTGVYAPAGEVIKITMSEEDLTKTGGVQVVIGQSLASSQANNIWEARDLNRMPIIRNVMQVNKTVSYVGFHLGGPIYVIPNNINIDNFSVTISGGVKYSHYIYGYTTEEEFLYNKDSSAPYFDFEVWDDGIRHSGPRRDVDKYTFSQLEESGLMWDKVTLFSNQFPGGSRSGEYGIHFLYDPFVAAGAMVAFPGRYSCNIPVGTMPYILDAKSFEDNPLNYWGVIHELNHHFQNFGLPNGTEVSNNSVNIATYAAYSDVSSNRNKDGGTNMGYYNDWWSVYTNPDYVMKEAMGIETQNNALSAYTSILHNIGIEDFIKAAQIQTNGTTSDSYYKAVSDASELDMTFFFKEFLNQPLSDDKVSEIQNRYSHELIPVSSIYQTGRTVVKEKEKVSIQTARPYRIEKNQPYTFDLNTEIRVPEEISYTVKNVTSPANGTLVNKGENIYEYTPDANERLSGEFLVTLSLTNKNTNKVYDDVDLIFEFEQYQLNQKTLEKTVYTYTDENKFNYLSDALDANLGDYTSAETTDYSNKTVAVSGDNYKSKNKIIEVKGKFKVDVSGLYRVAIRGRRQVALLFSLDGVNYERAANINQINTDLDQYDQTNSETYKDYYLEPNTFYYFKLYLLEYNWSPRGGMAVGLVNDDGKANLSDLSSFYRQSYVEEENVKYNHDYRYHHENGYNYFNQYSKTPTIVDSVYSAWDNTYSIDNLFDDNATNIIHSNKTSPVSEENPFSVTVDLGEEFKANSLTIVGEPSRKYYPKSFKLYAGTSVDNLALIGEYEDVEAVNSNITVSFPDTNMRYYKLVVTDTYDTSGYKYIAFRTISVQYSRESGKQIGLGDDRFTYLGDWKQEQAFATFGRLFTVSKGEAEFTFEGTSFAILSQYGSQYGDMDIYIDGVRYGNVNLNGGSSYSEIVYLSDILEEGLHTVRIVANGNINLDSIIVW